MSQNRRLGPHDDPLDSSPWDPLAGSYDNSAPEGASVRTTSSRLSHDDYTIAWICALYLELEVSRLIFDEEHASLPAHEGDDNSYILGRIAEHNVVMTALPVIYGKVNAANVARDLKRSFPNIRATLMVGIGGGAPLEADLYLGDVVVGTRVMEYDLGRALEHGNFEVTAIPKLPATILLSAVTNLRSKHGPSQLSPRALEVSRTRLSRYSRPSTPDILFQASYSHSSGAKTCTDCDRARLQPRRRRPTDDFLVHYGGVASGDSINRDVRKRDTIARRLDIMCFEMEAAGIMDSLACLPIRGICDYSDSHKNKDWQGYAAATAASYARELLETIAPLAGDTRIPLIARESSKIESSGKNTTNIIERRERLLRLLDFSRINARRDAIQPEHLKTCRWFLSHQKYLKWANMTPQTSCPSRLLWMRGKAGAGKSTMMKFIYHEAVNNKLAAVVVSFFFNARGDHLERSIEGMYRSLLKQTLVALPDLQWVLDRSNTDERVCPSLNSLKVLFRDVVINLGRHSVACFIDALDESNEDDVRDMVQFFEDLTDAASEQGIEFRVAFSSRPYPYVHIDEDLLITLDSEEGHKDDLAQYVQRCLKVPKSVKVELVEQILGKARGVFLWVELTVKILNKEASHGSLALRRRLSNIPPTLSQLFKEMLTRDAERPDELRRCVLWILCANRPLSPGEFCHAMWAGGLADGQVDEELPSTEDKEDIVALAASSSKGLVEITQPRITHTYEGYQSTVQFIHESVRDYLVKEKGLQDIWPDLGFEWHAVAHENLRRYCETYMTHPVIRRAIDPYRFINVAPSAMGLAKAYAFLEYATRNILEHADLAAPIVHQESFVSRFFNSLGSSALDCCQSLRERRYGQYAGPSHVLADRGLDNLLRQMGFSPVSPKFDDRLPYVHPLLAAISNDHKSTVAVLLGLSSMLHEGEDPLDGLRINADPVNLKTRTPMTWGAEEGRVPFLRLLVQSGHSLLERDRGGYTPLRSAIRSSQVDAVRFLVESGAGADAADHADAITETIRYDNRPLAILRAVKFLVYHGVDINSTGSDGSTALIAASRNGSALVVTYLISYGADLSARDSSGRTASDWAKKGQHRSVSRQLEQAESSPR
ncbi:hypothetical protein Micbo1qcDRAFT_151471 [Microdochium bolleyi]|uniref:Uncharacterized protein n=1 Tax=Microdochium bolleyi TaxID=196109 RepID=A0A136ISJ0_9PEZI|nr:hypothetical protein Micbo1qcDRAFT_151471 [Microdochium bolleyi]